MSESIPLLHKRYLARVTIEFETAFIVGGGRDLFFDDTFVSDANGLPAIPGSSLAGILRHAWKTAQYSHVEELFGHQDQGSPLEISWGCIHAANDVPVEGVVLNSTKIPGDVVLSEALTMAGRDHVRIDHKGAAAKGGKFDERSVSAGHRFTFELQLTTGADGDDHWKKLLALLTGGTLRLGGKTRRGYGAFKIVSLRERCFDLHDDFDNYVSHPVSLAEVCSWPDQIDAEKNARIGTLAGKTSLATVDLKPEGFWMFGGGFGGEANMNPVRANRVVWADDVSGQCQGSIEEQVALVPGSSVKGALAHRTAYYHNLTAKRFSKPDADYASDVERPLVGAENEAVQALFGSAKKNKSGQRGRVVISDIFVTGEQFQKLVSHVSIDRFTAGARSGFRFSEEPFFGGAGFTLNVLVTETDNIATEYLAAFKLALEDLADGLLPLGGGVNRGNGFFTGTVNWNSEDQQKENAYA